jgi:hypothetical protein
MDDLVERLREGFATNLEYEAADEIERLREALREIMDEMPENFACHHIARAALREASDDAAT